MDDGLSSVFSFLYLLGILFVRYGCCSLGGNWVGERFDAYDAVLFSDKKGGRVMWMDEGFMKTLNKSKFSREEVKKKIRES